MKFKCGCNSKDGYWYDWYLKKKVCPVHTNYDVVYRVDVFEKLPEHDVAQYISDKSFNVSIKKLSIDPSTQHNSVY